MSFPEERKGGVLPVFEILIPLMGAAVTVFVAVAAFVCTVVSMIRARKNKAIT